MYVFSCTFWGTSLIGATCCIYVHMFQVEHRGSFLAQQLLRFTLDMQAVVGTQKMHLEKTSQPVHPTGALTLGLVHEALG